MPNQSEKSRAWAALYAHPAYNPDDPTLGAAVSQIVEAERAIVRDNCEGKVTEAVAQWREKAADLAAEQQHFRKTTTKGAMACGTCSFFRLGAAQFGTCHVEPPTHEGFGRTSVGEFCSRWTDDPISVDEGKS